MVHFGMMLATERFGLELGGLRDGALPGLHRAQFIPRTANRKSGMWDFQLGLLSLCWNFEW